MFTEEIDTTQKCYILWIEGFERIGTHQTTVAISKLLSEKGFVFCTAATGGGSNDAYHTGTKSYRVKYNDFSAFENNFFDDYNDALCQTRSETDGWVSFLDYSDISVYFKKAAVRIWVMVSENNRILIHTYEFDNSFDMKLLVDDIKGLFSRSIEIEEIPQYIEVEPIDEMRKEREKNFLSFWSNEDTK